MGEDRPMKDVVSHGSPRRTRLVRSGIPRIRIDFDAEDRATGSRESGYVALDLSVEHSSGPDSLVRVAVKVGSSEQAGVEMCVGECQDRDTDYVTATPESVHSTVIGLMTALRVRPGVSMSGEIRSASADACETWQKIVASVLADRLIQVCSRDDAVRALDVAVVREVMSS